MSSERPTDGAAEAVGYEAATNGAALFDRTARTRLRVSGRAPGQMLNGILTGVIPAAPRVVEDGVLEGVATYHAVLTPKGKMISDLTVLLLGDESEPGFLLDVPEAGRDGLLEHLGKFVPPRFAAVEDVSDDVGCFAVVGPDAAGLLARLALGLRVEPDRLASEPEGAWHAVGEPGSALVVMRTEEVWPPAWSIYGPTEAVAALRRALVGAGAKQADLGAWETLRVEAGRPAFGIDMDEATFPPEAGIVERAIDPGKGCYTGQEVIVRIRDRGHVNRNLRRLEPGDAPVPARGTELLAVDSEKVVGSVTSAVRSPRRGGTLALAWVRRGVERVRLDGRVVDVC